METFGEWYRWLAAVGGIATVAAVGRLTWRGIWRLCMAELRATNCEQRERVLEAHAGRLLTMLDASGSSGRSSPDTRSDS